MKRFSVKLGLLLFGAAVLLALEIFYSIEIRKYSRPGEYASFFCGPITTTVKVLRATSFR
jgi:hypothetical protein